MPDVSGFAEARKAITTLFVTGWGTACPVAYPGGSFDQPDINTPWARFQIRNAGTDFAAIGGKMKRTRGTAFLQIFVPEHTGEATAYTLGDLFAATFDNNAISCASGQYIRLYCSTVTGPHDAGQTGLTMYNATVPFERDFFTDAALTVTVLTDEDGDVLSPDVN